MLIFHTTVKYAGVSIQHLLSLGSGSPAETLSICNWVLCWINQQFIFFTKITSSPLTQIYINNLCQITCQGKTYKILSYHTVTLSPIFHFLYFSNLYTRKVEIHCSRACKSLPTADLLDLRHRASLLTVKFKQPGWRVWVPIFSWKPPFNVFMIQNFYKIRFLEWNEISK